MIIHINKFFFKTTEGIAYVQFPLVFVFLGAKILYGLFLPFLQFRCKKLRWFC